MSSQSPRVQELLAANAKFTKSYDTPFNMKQLRELSTDPVLIRTFVLCMSYLLIPLPTARVVLISLLVTCMDPRVVPEEFVGPKPIVAVFRNAGGRATPDVVRTITVLRSLSYKADHASVMVIHHTGKYSPANLHAYLSR